MPGNDEGNPTVGQLLDQIERAVAALRAKINDGDGIHTLDDPAPPPPGTTPGGVGLGSGNATGGGGGGG